MGSALAKFKQPQTENIKKKNPEISIKWNLNFPCTGSYLDSIYIVLGIIRNLEMT